VGLPCDGCDAVFEGMPERIEWSARITDAAEPGEPLRIDGTVFSASGVPRAGVIVYAYQTNANGIYPTDDSLRGRSSHRHGRLRAWTKTDADGRYRFHTIRPAGYPNTSIPQHVHMHVIEPGRCTYYIDDIFFDDDPLLTPGQRRALVTGRGGNGVAIPARDADGTWIVRRDIYLGRAIPGYPSEDTAPETH
jgi:protocatechuate 3,4-dioxygenase beta subunit